MRHFSLPALSAGLFAGLLSWTGLAAAAEFPLDVELRTARTAAFGSVVVEAETDGSLLFEVRVDPAVVGDRADLDALHFNLAEDVEGLTLETLDAVRRPYRLEPVTPRWGARGADGARFDWRVDLDDRRSGRWMRRRGRHHPAHHGLVDERLQTVHFRLRADRPLDLEDLLPVSMTHSGVTVHMAARLDHGVFEDERLCAIAGALDPASLPAPEPEPEPTPEPPPPDDTVPNPGDVPPAPPGCTWVIDLFTGQPTVLECG
ncbi:MAG: hypothetical protein H6748_14635 [Spirochaetaceae bacterium]|nr:hypothetical protein [Spirochaetaceae bacterium]